MERPRPEDEPVTMQTLSLRRFMMKRRVVCSWEERSGVGDLENITHFIDMALRSNQHVFCREISGSLV